VIKLRPNIDIQREQEQFIDQMLEDIRKSAKSNLCLLIESGQLVNHKPLTDIWCYSLAKAMIKLAVLHDKKWHVTCHFNRSCKELEKIVYGKR